MIQSSYTAWLFCVSLTLVGFGTGVPKAIAQTNYEFSANYDTVVNITPLISDLSQAIESGESTDAPYGLNQYRGLVYAQTDLATGEVSFDADPAIYGLEDVPFGYFVLQGSDTNNKVFGTASATAVLDFENLTGGGSGTVTITGGEGLFTGATGILDFSEQDIINPDPNAISLRGKALVSGSIQAVPEPGTGTGTLVGMGVIGAGFLLRRCHRKSTV